MHNAERTLNLAYTNVGKLRDFSKKFTHPNDLNNPWLSMVFFGWRFEFLFASSP